MNWRVNLFINRCIFLLVLLLIFISSNIYAKGVPSEWELKRIYDEGKLYETGKIKVAVLNGSFYEMGRQYGGLMKEEIDELYNLMVKRDVLDKGIDYEELKKLIIDPSWKGMPKRHKEIIRGMSEVTDLSIDDLILLDMNLIVAARFSDEYFPPGVCCYFAAWGDYTKDGKLYCGRNLDWITEYEDFGPYLTVVVFCPNDGSNSVASVVYAGWVSLTTGMNDKKLFLEFNDGTHSAGSIYHSDLVPAFHETLDLLFDSDTIEDLGMRINTTRISWPGIISVANGSVSYCYEDMRYEVKRRSADTPGFIALANNFMLPEWGIIPKKDDITHSLLRYSNLLVLGEKYKGKIDLSVMEKIMDLPIINEDGTLGQGATFYSYKDSPGVTAIQVIAVPEEEKIWVRVPGYNDWTLVDLGPVFSGEDK